MFSFIKASEYISTISSLIGIIFWFINPTVTVICGIITLVDSVVQIFIGEQNNFSTEIIGIVIGLIFAKCFNWQWYNGTALMLCAESFTFGITGMIYLLVRIKRSF